MNSQPKIYLKAMITCLMATGQLHASPEHLKIAKKVAAQKFPGWTYGNSAAKKQVDCVQFVSEVLSNCLNQELSPEIKKSVFINYTFSDLSQAITEKDPRTRGIERSIVDLLKVGRKIEPSEVEPGDFIQYWMKSKKGAWLGHAAIVSSVIHEPNGVTKVTIYGAHKSSNGIGESQYQLNLSDPAKYVYLARLRD